MGAISHPRLCNNQRHLTISSLLLDRSTLSEPQKTYTKSRVERLSRRWSFRKVLDHLLKRLWCLHQTADWRRDRSISQHWLKIMPKHSLTRPVFSLHQSPTVIVISMISTNQSKLSNNQTLVNTMISSTLRKITMIRQQVKMTNTSGTRSRSSRNGGSMVLRYHHLCFKRRLTVMVRILKKIAWRGFWLKQLSHHHWSFKHQVAPFYLIKLCLRRLKYRPHHHKMTCG